MAETDEVVRAFFLSDEISRQHPGKRDYVTIKRDGKRIKLQKKTLVMTVMEAFRLFKKEHPNLKIEKSKFAALRPVNVVPVSDKDQNVCCCQYHENFELLVNGIRKHLPNVPSSETLIEQTVCGWYMACYTGVCDNCKEFGMIVDDLFDVSEHDETVIEYYQWNDQYRKELVSSSLGEAKAVLKQQLGVMRRHVFIAKTQLRAIKTLRGQLEEGEALLQEDFSENYSIKQQNEIMSAHWVSTGVTLFTAVLNTTDGVKSFVVVSDELHHDKYAVATFNRKILELANADGRIRQLHMFTDGAGSQFKNRFTLSLLNWPSEMHENLEKVDWSFFGTAHGKGPVDGVGGTVKRAVLRRTLQGQSIVNNAAEFAEVAMTACPNVTVLYVPASEVAEVKLQLDVLWDNHVPTAIPQLRAHHYIYSDAYSPGSLHVAIISPFATVPIRAEPVIEAQPTSSESAEPVIETTHVV